MGTISVEQQGDDCFRMQVGDRVWLTHDPAGLVPVLEGAVERHRSAPNPFRRASPRTRERPGTRLRRLLTRRRRRATPRELVARTARVFGSTMTYFEAGKGPPVVFLHGGVASARMWRNVIPLLPHNRCIAVDLIGTGESEPPAEPDAPDERDEFTWQQHARYLGEFLDVVGVTHDITLVTHGWSPLVVYQWSLQNRERLRGLAFVEAIVAPFGYRDLDESIREIFLLARGEDGHEFVVDSDALFDKLIDAQTLEPLAAEVADAYRATTRTGCHAIYVALRQLPIGGEPRESVEIARKGNTWLCETELPKLIVLGRPGALSALVPNDTLSRAPNLTVATMRGRHLLPEDSPESLALCIKMWLSRLGPTTHTKRR